MWVDMSSLLFVFFLVYFQYIKSFCLQEKTLYHTESDWINLLVRDNTSFLLLQKMGNDTTCSLWPGQPRRCDILVAIEKICPSISVVACCFIMLVIILFKKYHVFVQRMIFGLTFSAMLQSASYFLGNMHSKSNNLICHVQAFTMQFFAWSTLSWVVVITVNMVLIIKGIDSKKFEKHYHAFVWLNALFWACIPFIKDAYGPAGIWCWVVKDHHFLRFAVWYAPLLIICVAMLLTYLYIFIHNRRMAKSARGTELHMLFKTYRKEVKPLVIYPWVYIVLTIPIFVYRLYDVMHPNKEPSFGLLLAAVIFTPSVGCGNAIAYAFYNKTIRELTWRKFKQAFYLSVVGKDCNIRPYTVDSLQASSYSSKRPSIKPESLEFHNKWFDQENDCRGVFTPGPVVKGECQSIYGQSDTGNDCIAQKSSQK